MLRKKAYEGALPAGQIGVARHAVGSATTRLRKPSLPPADPPLFFTSESEETRMPSENFLGMVDGGLGTSRSIYAGHSFMLRSTDMSFRFMVKVDLNTENDRAVLGWSRVAKALLR